MKYLILSAVALLAVGCAKSRYTFTVYEQGVKVGEAKVTNSLDNTLIVVRDNETKDWVAIPGTAVRAKLYPNRVDPTTQPTK